ncbi:vitamin B12-dependent ribonucleotide reductase [Candidatus Woesearchaeota archaeon]|nr:vitamin B12-dependent ribonucleotide reductase [Candidatus Woesearchaeota archaeon]MBW2994018.1 vitamin B12-dependent ribonucleotide reductase [Candidatus Woesearchaeota archaeon]
MVITQIKKRNGELATFDRVKISSAIYKAAVAVGGKDRARADDLARQVEHVLTKKFEGTMPTVEHVQDIVETVLIDQGHGKTAKAYILYRQRHKEVREAREIILGKKTSLKLSLNSLAVLKGRYLLKDPVGNIIETPEELFHRVAENISLAEPKYGGNAKEIENKFYDFMTSLDFMPCSPTLMNAGAPLQQLSACFVLPIGDSIKEIFEAVKSTAIIHQTGGGTGFSFSKIRPRNDVVISTKGIASGPLSFIRVFDTATDVINQGGKRRGANMGILRIDHPDIMDFIVAKEKTNVLNNFNISVALTDDFMEKAKKGEDYELISPRTRKVVQKLNAKKVFDLIVLMAWKNGEPGIVFIDKINKDNPTPEIGEIESTNPCGEQPLLPYESCNLGSINLAKFIKEGKQVDWDRLRDACKLATHFMDNVIDMNNLPLPEIEEMTRSNRKIGIGVMGWADMLYQMRIPYNSDEAVQLAEKVMKFVDDEIKIASEELASKRGAFPNIQKSIYKDKTPIRNAARTTIAPTGTISMIADCSSGIEPLFSIAYIKRVMEGKELVYVNQHFKNALKEAGIYSDELIQKVTNRASIQDIEEIPAELRKVFVTAFDITPEWHIKMQAAFQKYTNNAVSKTVNFPQNATTAEVEQVYMMAYDTGCKGATVYRDGSREGQILNVKSEKEEDKTKTQESPAEEVKQGSKGKFDEKNCPECETGMVFSEGCSTCPSCGYSKCSL